MSKLIDDVKSAAVAVQAAVTAVRALIADLQTLHVTIPWLGWFVTPTRPPPTVDPVHGVITVKDVEPGRYPWGVTPVSVTRASPPGAAPVVMATPFVATGTLTETPAPHEVPTP